MTVTIAKNALLVITVITAHKVVHHHIMAFSVPISVTVCFVIMSTAVLPLPLQKLSKWIKERTTSSYLETDQPLVG
uniref:Uncharacterized protein n=1 Tax=Magallana gigas TaxID=29159 RepID=A0A8W8LV43_MAGGI